MSDDSFGDYVELVHPRVIIFAPDERPQLSGGDMIDQMSAIKEVFDGRWPSEN